MSDMMRIRQQLTSCQRSFLPHLLKTRISDRIASLVGYSICLHSTGLYLMGRCMMQGAAAAAAGDA